MAAKTLEGRQKRLSIVTVWGLAMLGVIATGLSQWNNFRSETVLQGRLDSIEKTGKGIASDIKTFVIENKSIKKEVPTNATVKRKDKEQKSESSAVDNRKSTNTESLSNVEKGITDLKKLITGQTWGLSAEQLVMLSRRLAPFAKPEDRGDLITCILGNSDSYKFAVSLLGAFKTAGWNLSGSGLNQAIYNNNPTGIIIQINSRESRPPGLNEFVISLREAGIEPTGWLSPDVPSDRFRIIVGMKP